ncbi:MAG: bifunctional riboflavin kinase/FAD synthetase [Mariprofundaceae bacterium]
MRIFRSFESIMQAAGAHHGAVTVGNFDGVHMGHAQILAELKGHALAVGGPAVAVTFEPHPRAILFPEEAPRRLCHLHERLELLGKAGMDEVLLLHFTHELAGWPPEKFARHLYAGLKFRHMHVGYDFAFGHDRSGHIDNLRELGEQMAFTVSEASAFEMHAAVVSSSRIRSAIEAADFGLAEDLLGRPYAISGHVGRGEQRGRKLGFPTANLDMKDLAHPPPGIYAVRASCGEQCWNGAAYLGFRPTFAGRTLILETHILDGNPDLYKKRLNVTFVQRVREDRAFKGAEELSEQIARDCEQARHILM